MNDSTLKLELTELYRVEVPDDYPYDYDGDIEPTPWEPSEGEEVRERMEERKRAYFAGEWSMTGVIAVAKTLYRTDVGGWLTGPEIQSAGLWGVESDAGEDYLNEIYADELDQLRDMLLASGISADEVNQAVDAELARIAPAKAAS